MVYDSNINDDDDDDDDAYVADIFLIYPENWNSNGHHGRYQWWF